MKHEKKEENFKGEVIEKLKERRISLLNLQQGVFDAFLEDYCFFVEFKILKYEPAKYHEYEIQFNENQTELLRVMKRKPYILIKKDWREKNKEEVYYLFTPKVTGEMVAEFEEGERKDKRKLREFWHSEYRFEDQGALKFSNVTDLVNGFVKDLQTRKTL